MNNINNKKYKLGLYWVLPEHNKLQFEQQEIRVEPKIMQVLCYLVRHRGKVVSRDEIISDLWPEQVIGSEVVTRAIFELRKIFKDDPKSPQFIETIARKGYSFIYPIEVTGVLDVTKVDNANEFTLYNKRFYLVISFLTLFILLFSFFGFNQRLHNEEVENFRATLINQGESTVNDPVISPDGKKIVYIEQLGGNNILLLMSLNNHRKEIITEFSGQLISPRWKGDNLVYYAQCIYQKCDLVEHNFELQSSKVIERFNSKIRSMDVNQSLIAIESADTSRSNTSRSNISLFEYNAKSFKLVESPISSELNRMPLFSYDGSYIYFVAANSEGGEGISRYHLETKVLTKLEARFNAIYSMSNKSQSEIWITGRKKGISAIWKYDVDTGKTIEAFTPAPGDYPTDISAVPGSNKIIYRSVQRDIDSFQIGLSNNAIADINGDMIDMNTIYSPIINTYYFVSNRSGYYEIWSSKEGSVKKMTDIYANVIERPILSVDEKLLSFTSSTANGSMLWVLDVFNEKQVLKYTLPSRIHLLSWSPEGNLFFSMSSLQQENIYEFSVEDLTYKQIILSAGKLAIQNVEGGLLYFYKNATKSVMALNSTGEINSVFKLPSQHYFVPHQSNVIGDEFLFTTINDGQYSLNSYSMSNHETNKVFDLPANSYPTQIGEVDQQTFVIFDKLIRDKTQLYLLEND
ncbi:winged helix-turn-helix domain-containing protein [Shewanella sp. 1_MG-2023]|uniref:winged helix-turn-helix domain-containing protein n=1 Tax=unclassified Shewanella TaxID=196818 RepID=UPI0026E39305|nr:MULTISPECIES: winged helix-turn-helix domain-containing protein [unclassified Shewanella]MDO6612164.1 winged helix-turn-helix domain-containing protein [Shewanella sp. 7_MG-2023]MDO6772018.1 winged helix-turn-helix domain-containing protein [Shewanella sp. 2_MG-2023]MDO6795758.1 winged helix-turn-helix domain-containing protein [Shewanella sp. 1_MG-2023]